MKLLNSTYEYIKEEVVALFIEYDIKCIPVSGFELAHKMGFRIIPYSSLSKLQLEYVMEISEDGFFTDYSGEETIFYNDNKKYRRVNMTFLHEIGHCVLGHSEKMDPDTMEAEAKFFAKYAAAPPPLVHKIRPDSEYDIAEMFDLSYEASIYAYDFYRKWLRKKHQTGSLTYYEKSLLHQFRDANFTS